MTEGGKPAAEQQRACGERRDLASRPAGPARRVACDPPPGLASAGARDRPRRAADHRPRPARPVRLRYGPAGAVASARCSWSPSRRRVAGVVTGLAEASEVAPDRLAAPPGLPPASPPISSSSRCGWRGVLLDPRRALGLVLPPAGAREKTALWAEPPAAAAEGERLTDRQRALLDALPALRRRRLARAAPPRDARLVALGAARARRPAHAAVGARAAAGADRRPGGGAGRHRGRTRAARACCCTASPARARRRSTCAPPRRRSPRAGRIVLVPEIALTPQIVARFARALRRHRRGPALGARRRASATTSGCGCAAGEARVCVGPRSAVFAPMADLGLIVVDEEHDASYKHEGDPRYDARLVAERRARGAGAVLVPGSATRARRASQRCGASARRARRRAPLPPVEVLDMREARARAAPAHARGARRSAQGDRAAQPPGVVELPLLPLCGHVWGCPTCDVALVLHRARGAPRVPPLRPPRAGPARCDACGSVSVARHGAGTERLRHELAAVLDGAGPPPRRRRRGDAGAACSPPSSAAPARLLVGTQMVAKGHDFPDVDARRRPRRRRDAALPRLPRRGADVRARRPARRPRRPRAGRRGGCSCRRSHPSAPRSAWRRATPPTASSPPSCAAASRCAIRRSRPSSASSARRRGAAAQAAARRPRAARRSPGGRAGPGPAVPPARPGAHAGRRQGPRPPTRRSPRSARRVQRPRRKARSTAGVNFSVDVDPQ